LAIEPTSALAQLHTFNDFMENAIAHIDALPDDFQQRREYVDSIRSGYEECNRNWNTAFQYERQHRSLDITMFSQPFQKEYARLKVLAPQFSKTAGKYASSSK
jgi:hypothetical protein